MEIAQNLDSDSKIENVYYGNSLYSIYLMVLTVVFSGYKTTFEDGNNDLIKSIMSR